MPSNSEELRTKLRIEGNTWLLLSAKFKNRTWLRNIFPSDWAKLTDHILGDKVFNMQVPRTDGLEGTVSLSPPWSIVLNYEHAVRKKAFKDIRNGVYDSLSESLKNACRDSEMKELYFTSPIALSHRSTRPRGDVALPPVKWPKVDAPHVPAGKGIKGTGKGGKKGRKGRNNKGGGKGLLSKTPDGRAICFAFNAQGCAGGCNMVHVCRIAGCLADHPMTQHGTAKR
jgi:hypothetical protein